MPLNFLTRNKNFNEYLAYMNAQVAAMVNDDQPIEAIVAEVASVVGISPNELQGILDGTQPKMFRQHFDALNKALKIEKAAVEKMFSKLAGLRGLHDNVDAKGFWGPTSYDELAEERAAQQAINQMYDEFDTFVWLAWNIFDDPDVTDKGGMIASLAKEFANRVNDVAADADDPVDDDDLAVDPFKTTIDRAKSHPITIYKDIETGMWVWAGIYSNNVIDRENEILTAAAHKDFERALNAGECEMPELWLFHIPFAVGKAHVMSYDQVDKNYGFAYIAGTFYPEFAFIAEQLADKADNDLSLGMSHGMPREQIKYDNTDKNLIIQYRSKEVSALPREFAANLLTTFDPDVKELTKMSLTDEQRAKLGTMLDPDTIGILEEMGKAAADSAKANGLRSKDAAATTSDDPPSDNSIDSPPTPSDTENSAADESQPAVAETNDTETRQVDDTALLPIVQSVQKALEPVSVRLKAVEDENATLKKQISDLLEMVKKMLEQQANITEGLTLPPAARQKTALEQQLESLENLFTKTPIPTVGDDEKDLTDGPAAPPESSTKDDWSGLLPDPEQIKALEY